MSALHLLKYAAHAFMDPFPSIGPGLIPFEAAKRNPLFVRRCARDMQRPSGQSTYR
jgi:hypothetical protein